MLYLFSCARLFFLFLFGYLAAFSQSSLASSFESSMNNFSFQLARELTNENIILGSPSIHIALGLVSFGAKEGATRNEMARVLYSEQSQYPKHILAEAYKKCIEDTTRKIQYGPVVKISNEIAISDESGLIDTYRDYADSLNTTFKNKAGLDSSIVLTNNISFTGSWQNAFSYERTHEGHFYLLDGKTKSLPLMAQVTCPAKFDPN
jgi:serine protease inhibitor